MKLQGRALEYVAGAYVLGTLPLRARRRFEAMLRQDLSARRLWLRWEERLSGLAAGVLPVRPEDSTWLAVLARVQPAAARRPMGTRRWVLVASLVLAVAVTVLMVRLPQAPLYTASVRNQTGQTLWEISAPREAQSLDLRALRGGQVPTARDYELWALAPGGGPPVSLGLMPREGRARLVLTGAQRAALLAANQLALSDEPRGGSPSGAPTGAVLFVVDLVRASAG